MRTAVALVSLACSSLLAHGAGERLTLAQPKNSGLTLLQLNKKDDLYAKFSGQVRVGGTFMGFWPEGATNRSYKEPEYLFVPDKQSSAQLPHFVLRDPPYFRSYRVRSVMITAGLEALREASGDENVNRLLQRRVNHIRLTGYFVLEDFVVGVECDGPWASAKLLKAELPEHFAMKHSAAPEGC